MLPESYSAYAIPRVREIGRSNEYAAIDKLPNVPLVALKYI